MYSAAPLAQHIRNLTLSSMVRKNGNHWAKAGAIGFFALFSSATPLTAEDSITQKLQPFFQKHCLSCHGPKKERGDLRVDKLSASLDHIESVEHLQNILDEITIDGMPPEEEPRPSSGELSQIIPLITEHIKKAKTKHSSGGGKPVRRLTKIEYTNTVYDLLGVHINADSLPNDGSVGIFDTEARALYTTDLYFENYLEVAQDAVTRFIASRSQEPGEQKTASGKKEKPNKKFVMGNAKLPPAGHLKARFACWLESPQPEPIFTGPIDHETYQVLGTQKKPLYIEKIFYKQESATGGPELWSIPRGMVLGKEIQYFQVISPEPYQFFKPFLARYSKGDPPDSAAVHLIRQFVKLMNRGREVDPILVKQLNEQFLAGRKREEKFWDAIVEPMALAMCTIESMFHFEDKNPKENRSYISAVELTNRLSYFLWRSAPDQELLKLAQSKDIHVTETRIQQIERMMKHPKFDRFIRDFSSQWLELERQDSIAVDPLLFNKFNSATKSSIKEETIQFMSHVIKNDLPLGNLIDSDFVMINNVMANHYGMRKLEGDAFRAVPLPPKSRRGGLLTQAGILMQTGTGDRTSIVERGVFISKKMLSSEPPPPPALVGDLPNDSQSLKKLTGAELVRKHAASTQCASCHSKIDPLGLGLEEFDAIGLYRTKDVRLNPNFYKQRKRDRVSKKNLTFEVELETSGKIFTGQTFKGTEGLKKALLKNQHRLTEAYIEALFTFANGRKAGITEEAFVDDIVKQASSVSYPAGSILKAVIESEGFKNN